MATSLLKIYWQNALGDPVVMAVLVVLLFMSLSSWGIFFFKLLQLRSVARREEIFHSMIDNNAPIRSILAKRVFSKEVPFDIFVGFAAEEGVVSRSRLEAALLMARTCMERGLSFVATVGNTAPFVGLFGTVWGIMKSFHAIGLRQEASLAVVAPGISEALVNTAIGLLVAIPAVFFYNLLTKKIDGILDRSEAYGLIFIERYGRMKGEEEGKDFV